MCASYGGGDGGAIFKFIVGVLELLMQLIFSKMNMGEDYEAGKLGSTFVCASRLVYRLIVDLIISGGQFDKRSLGVSLCLTAACGL